MKGSGSGRGTAGGMDRALPEDPSLAAPVAVARKAVDATAGRAAATVFGALSWVRRSRVFHPAGVAFEAVVTVEPEPTPTGAALLDEHGRYRAVVRLSRGVGLPSNVPDILGLAVRMLDSYGPGRHQDFLMVTAGGSAPGLRHLLVPVRSFGWSRYSTLLPYRTGTGLVVVGAQPSGDPGLRLRTFEEVADALVEARLRFALEVAPVRGDWRRWGALDVGRRLDPDEGESLRFDPFRSGPDLVPAGMLNTLRRRAYRASQDARPTPMDSDPTIAG